MRIAEYFCADVTNRLRRIMPGRGGPAMTSESAGSSDCTADATLPLPRNPEILSASACPLEREQILLPITPIR